VIAAVTGGTGHIGANLVRALLARGLRVRSMIHSGEEALDGLDVERVPGDVLEPDTLRALFDGADVAFHLAALISVDGDQGGRVPAINVEGAHNAARAAREAGVRRYVHFSSIHAYDHDPADAPLDEARQRVGERHPAYDRSKAAGEERVRAEIARGLDAVIVNPTGVIGPHDYNPSRMGEMLMLMANRRLPGLVGGGFDWVDARDVCEGAISAAERGGRGENYILSGRWRSIVEIGALTHTITGVKPPWLVSPLWLAYASSPLVAAWCRLTGTPLLFTPESLSALKGSRMVCHDKASRELGYAPRPFEDTLRDTFAWFEEAGRLG